MSKHPITVFYDAKCGLCSKEIRYYQSIAPANVFIWQDVNAASEVLAKRQVTVEQALAIFHVLDQQGQLRKGVDAFIVIWEQLRYWRYLSYLVRLPLIKQAVGVVYRLFARWRFKRYTHCQISSKDAND